MKTFQPRLEILPPEQRHLWEKLAPTKELGMVLYGGTAVSLHLGHRVSLDFDFFSGRPLDRKEMEDQMTELKGSTTVQSETDAWSVAVDTGLGTVRLAFFGDLSMGIVAEPLVTSDGMLKVASLLDLLACKLKVILQRAAKKDYQDIDAILGAGLNLETGLGAAQALYGPAFSPAESLRALTYFEDGNLRELNESTKARLRDHAKNAGPIPVIPLVANSIS